MLLFIDTETTGVEQTDRICSLALLEEDKAHYELINEQKKIPSEASAIHHITKEMLKDKPRLLESKIAATLQKYNSDAHTLVGHNIMFDVDMLRASGVNWRGGVIDTMRVTKHLIPECEQFSLQFLRYELRLYKEESALLAKYGIKDALVAHHALSDALVTQLLFEYLLELCSVEKMLELTFQNVLIQKFNFGKYKGHYVEEICMNVASYALWLKNSTTDEDMAYTLEYYLQG